MGRTNYIYIDFENVQETDLDRIANKPVKVRLVLGERHKSLPVKLVKQLQKFAEQVSLIETKLNGKNALDFVLAYEIGVESAKDPDGYFHVLSRDKGFDALISRLKDKKILAARHAAFSEVPVLMNLEERACVLANYFKAHPNNRPKLQKTLTSQIMVVFGNSLTPAEVAETIQKLVGQKIITVSEKGSVAYPY
jgi:hypothetical protein